LKVKKNVKAQPASWWTADYGGGTERDVPSVTRLRGGVSGAGLRLLSGSGSISPFSSMGVRSFDLRAIALHDVGWPGDNRIR